MCMWFCEREIVSLNRLLKVFGSMYSLVSVCRSRLMLIVKSPRGHNGVSEGIMYASPYFVYLLLNICLGWRVMFWESLHILAVNFDVCSSRHAAREGMPAIVRILWLGLERKVPMESQIPVLWIGFKIFSCDSFAVENNVAP